MLRVAVKTDKFARLRKVMWFWLDTTLDTSCHCEEHWWHLTSLIQPFLGPEIDCYYSVPTRGSVDILLDKTVTNKDVFKNKSERQSQTGDHGQIRGYKRTRAVVPPEAYCRYFCLLVPVMKNWVFYHMPIITMKCKSSFFLKGRHSAQAYGPSTYEVKARGLLQTWGATWATQWVPSTDETLYLKKSFYMK